MSADPAPSPAYAVRRLTLTAFRSYAALTLEADARPVVLVGENGAGKTNILEALSLLSPGRGLRGAALADSARRLPGEAAPAGPWAVAATVEGPDGSFEIGTGLSPAPDGRLTERRAAHINGVAAPASTALSETCRVVWLTPQMDRLFLDSPGGRRRFLDRLTLAFEPGHARARTVERLKADLAPLTGAFPQGLIAVTGAFEETRAPGDDGEARFREALARRRRTDAEAGRTGFGPHTADLAVTHVGRGRPAAECSTGEQKALLIGLVLAAARAQTRADAGAAPLLLLDEIAAHLDERRRAALFDEICAIGAQAWMTGTDAALFAAMGGRGQGFCVTNGALNPI